MTLNETAIEIQRAVYRTFDHMEGINKDYKHILDLIQDFSNTSMSDIERENIDRVLSDIRSSRTYFAKAIDIYSDLSVLLEHIETVSYTKQGENEHDNLS